MDHVFVTEIPLPCYFSFPYWTCLLEPNRLHLLATDKQQLEGALVVVLIGVTTEAITKSYWLGNFLGDI